MDNFLKDQIEHFSINLAILGESRNEKTVKRTEGQRLAAKKRFNSRMQEVFTKRLKQEFRRKYEQ